MRLRIDDMEIVDIEGRYGVRKQLKVTSGNRIYQCWMGKWNQDWKVGDTVLIELNKGDIQRPSIDTRVHDLEDRIGQLEKGVR